MSGFKNHAVLALGMLQTKKQLPPKQEQEIKHLLDKIMCAFNCGDKACPDEACETLEDTMLKIIEIVNQDA